MVHVGALCYISSIRHILFHYVGTVESCDEYGFVKLKMVERIGERIVARVHSTKLRVLVPGVSHPSFIRYMQGGYSVLPLRLISANVELILGDVNVRYDTSDDSANNDSESYDISDPSTSNDSEILSGSCAECGSIGPLGIYCLNAECGETSNIYAR